MPMRINSLEQLIDIAGSQQKKRIAVAAAADETVLTAINSAYSREIIDPLLIGNKKEIVKICTAYRFNHSGWEIINEKDPFIAAQRAVEEIKSGNADILMKGLVSTAPLLKAVLDKDSGLKKSNILSHFALFQTCGYHKLFGLSDAAMNILPGISEKTGIIENAVEIFHKLGHNEPKVAILTPVEVLNEKIQSTIDAVRLKELNGQNRIKGCIIDGPLALDIAISMEATRHKNIQSAVAGDADILIAPDLNSGNILYKSLIFFCGAESAAVVTGAKIPIVLTSRADSDKSKLYSIALAALL